MCDLGAKVLIMFGKVENFAKHTHTHTHTHTHIASRVKLGGNSYLSNSCAVRVTQNKQRNILEILYPRWFPYGFRPDLFCLLRSWNENPPAAGGRDFRIL